MNLHPRVFFTLLAVAVAAVVTAIVLYLRPPTQVGAGPQLSLEKLGQLISLKVNYSAVLELEKTKSLAVLWFDPVKYGGTKVLFVAKGDCTIGTDLTAAKIKRLSASSPGTGNTVEVTLSKPHPLHVSVSHAPRKQGGSYFYSVDDTLLHDSATHTRAMEQAMTVAESDIKTTCSRSAIIESARQNAETVLTAFLTGAGERPVFHWL